MAPGDKPTTTLFFRTYMRTIAISATQAALMYAIDDEVHVELPGITHMRARDLMPEAQKPAPSKPWQKSRAEQWKANRKRAR